MSEKNEEDFHIALAQIEVTDATGQRSYVNPGSPVFGLKDPDRLLKLKAIRLPTTAEVELEALRRESRDAAKAKSEKKDEGNGGNENGGNTSRRNRGGTANDTNSGI